MDEQSLQKAVNICDEIKELLESLKKPEIKNNPIENESPQSPENVVVHIETNEEKIKNNLEPAGLSNNRQNRTHVNWIHSLRSISNYIRPHNY